MSCGAAAYALSLAQEFQAHLTLLHVIGDAKVGELLRAEDLVTSSTRLLRSIVSPEAELRCEPRFVVEKGSVAEKILKLLSKGERI